MKKKQVLAISGSTRENSTNRQYIDAFSNIAKDMMNVTLYKNIADLPAFNPDQDNEITTSAGLSGFSQDAGGHLTVDICQTPSGGSCTAAGATINEYLFLKVLSNITAQIIARGRFHTVAATYTAGATIFASALSARNDTLLMYGIGDVETDYALNGFVVANGNLTLDSNLIGGNGRYAYLADGSLLNKFTDNTFAGLTILYEDALALASASGCGNTFLTIQIWECQAGGATGSTPFIQNFTSNGTFSLSGYYTCDATGGTVVVTVPAGSTNSGAFYSLTKTDTSANACSMARTGSDLLGGARGLSLGTSNDSRTIKNNNGSTNWIILP